MSARSTAERIDRWRGRATGAMAISGLAVGAGAAVDTQAFLQSWLWSYFFVIGPPLGCLALGLITQVAHGGWGTAARPILSSSARTIPAMAVLFLPIAVGLDALYPWAQEGAAARDALLAHKAPWLNEPGFLIRSGIYFCVFLLGLRAMDHGVGPRHRMQDFAAPLLLLYAMAMTFAAIDWGMSLEPHWYSTMYGAIEVVGQGLTAFCVSVLFAGLLFDSEPFGEEIDLSRFHDLGKFFFAFVFLWGYTSFSQLLIIWSGNLAEEAPWYLRRSSHGWEIIAELVGVLHFALPFAVLLSKRVKRNIPLMIRIAGGFLVVRAFAEFFLIAPAFHVHAHAHWMDLATPAFLFSVWLFLFTRNLRQRVEAPAAEGEGIEAEGAETAP